MKFQKREPIDSIIDRLIEDQETKLLKELDAKTSLKQEFESRSLPVVLIFRSALQRRSLKKGVLRNFAKFTAKQSCQNKRSLFLNKVTASGCR